MSYITRLTTAGVLFSLTTTASAQVVTKYTYDAGDNVATVTDPRSLVTSYSYDGLGNKWQQASPDTGTTSYSYDAYGRLAGIIRSDGSQVTYAYDGINRRATETAGGQTHTFTYDTCTNGTGRLCSLSDTTGTTSYTYTPEGWVTARGFLVNGVGYSLAYSYNSLGQVTAVSYPGAIQALYTYSAGVVSGVQVVIGGVTSNVATNITYQPGDSAMSQWTSSNGIVNTLSYDTDGRLTGIQAPGAQSLALSYDAANRVNGIIDGVDTAMTQSFGYDAMSRLNSVYAGADNEAFQYDGNGNRLSQVVNGASGTLGVNVSSNQVTGLSGSTNTSYAYDAKGNLTTVNGAVTFTFDPFNRMSSAGGTTYYVNPEGQRIAKTVSGAINYFAPDASGPLMAEYQAANSWTYYVWLNGRLVGRINQGTLLAVHDDQVGRPAVMTDANKAIAWRARNFVFDRSVTVANPVPLNLGFPGQYYDAESGLWNNGFRDYSAGLGRYIESDPLGLAPGINTYAYAGSSPLILTDPLGLAPDRNLFMPGTLNWYNAQLTPSGSGVYTIAGHGSPRTMDDSSTGVVNTIAPEDLASSLMFDPSYHQGMPIKLLSCDTAKGKNSFAEQLSKLTHSDVTGSPSTFLTDSLGNAWAGAVHPTLAPSGGSYSMSPVLMNMVTFHGGSP